MKIFLCSTSYDLEDLRALIVHRFSGQHEFVHFEDAAFPSRRGLHSHDQCIEAVKQADVVVCIIDKRYGGRYHGDRAADFPPQEVQFRAHFGKVERTVKQVVLTNELSISWCELLTAYGLGRYVITFARQRTLNEKATRRRNQQVKSFSPAYVDDPRVFDLIDWITHRPKDNWIIPFHDAVDFEGKLAKWLAVADDSLAPGEPEDYDDRRPIVVILEGQTDMVLAKAVASALKLRHPSVFISANGKRPLINGLAKYFSVMNEAVEFVVLMDADTDDPDEVAEQKAQMTEILTKLNRPKAQVVFAVPTIESWLEQKPASPNELKRLAADLEKNALSRANAVPSLRDFVQALKTIDAMPE